MLMLEGPPNATGHFLKVVTSCRCHLMLSLHRLCIICPQHISVHQIWYISEFISAHITLCLYMGREGDFMETKRPIVGLKLFTFDLTPTSDSFIPCIAPRCYIHLRWRFFKSQAWLRDFENFQTYLQLNPGFSSVLPPHITQSQV